MGWLNTFKLSDWHWYHVLALALLCRMSSSSVLRWICHLHGFGGRKWCLQMWHGRCSCVQMGILRYLTINGSEFSPYLWYPITYTQHVTQMWVIFVSDCFRFNLHREIHAAATRQPGILCGKSYFILINTIKGFALLLENGTQYGHFQQSSTEFNCDSQSKELCICWVPSDPWNSRWWDFPLAWLLYIVMPYNCIYPKFQFI